MSTGSMLRQVYLKQQTPVPPTSKKNAASKVKANLIFAFTSLLVGGLIVGIALAVVVVFYVKKLESEQNTTQRPTLSSTTPVALRWNTTGIQVAGRINSSGSGSDQLNLPGGIALDSINSLHIADRMNRRVQKYDANILNGSTVAGQTNGTSGLSANQLNIPGCITVDPSNNMYISDSSNHRIQRWSNNALSGITIAGNGTSGNGSNQLSFPYGTVYDSTSGFLYIADHSNHRVMRYTSGSTSGTLIAGGNGCGNGTHQICFPLGLWLDKASNSLLISSFSYHSIVRWSIGASNWSLVAGTHGRAGNASNQLNGPIGLTVDSMGNLYVVDRNNHRIQFFSANQQNATTIAGITGRSGNALNLLSSPFWLALDTQMNVYVSDMANHRVMKYLRY